jgi:hypothetical protein
MARMGVAMVGTPALKIEVFRSRAEADAWIAANRPAPIQTAGPPVFLRSAPDPRA